MSEHGMPPDRLRLECVKLAVQCATINNLRDPAWIVDMARQLEQYVCGDTRQAAPKRKRPGRPPKSAA